MQKVARVKEARKRRGKGQEKGLKRAMAKNIPIACKYGECHDSSENSDFLLLRQKDSSAWCAIFRNILSKFQRVHIFVKSRKVQNTAQSTKMPMEFIQNCTFSTRQYRKKGTCLGFIFTQFVIYSLVILLS